MNVPCTRVAIGNYAFSVLKKEKGERERWSYSNVAALTKSSLDITLEYTKVIQHEDGPDMIYVVDAKIQVTKRDLIRVDASLYSSSPFLSILLNKEAASKVKIHMTKLREMRRALEGSDINYYSGEGDSRITLFLTHPGLFMASMLGRCFKNKVKNLSSQEASALLEQSKLSSDKILYDIELQLDNKFRNQLASRVKDRQLIFEPLFGPCLQSDVMDISPSVLAHELRRVSSFIHLFRDSGATKESFEKSLKDLKNLDRFEEFMRSLNWRYEMIEEDMSVRLQRCSMCPKPGFLKCSSCMTKRYCGEACQARDVLDGHMTVCKEVDREEKVKRAVIDRIVQTIFISPDGVTYNYFYDKVIKIMNSLTREVMKRNLNKEDSFTDTMIKNVIKPC